MPDHDDAILDTAGCHSCRDVTRRGFLSVGSCTMTAILTGLGRSEGREIGSGEELTYPIPSGDGTTIDRQAQVILVRQQQSIYAFNLSCPHQNAAVRWVADGQRFQCSRHDSRYLSDGTHTSGRATRNMDRFPVHRDGTNIRVDVSRLIRSDQDPAGWAGAFVRIE
jgi:nitrite reductase/ring-hydroxylating ferredoxin subunit